MRKPSSKQVSWGLALLAAALAAGCGRDCEDLCEEAQACAGAAEDQEEGEEEAGCAVQCEDAVAQAEVAGCDDPYEDYLGCLDDVDDVCTVGNACDAETGAYTSCITAYCAVTPDDLACQDPPGA